MADRRALLVLGPSSGGIRRHVACLAEGLPARGWQVTVAGPPDVMRSVGRQDHVVPVAHHPGALRAARRSLRALVVGADVVHAHGLTAGWVAASLRRRPPLVVTVHNLVLPDAAGRATTLWQAIEARLPARADRTVAVSGEVARRFTGRPGAERVVVVPPAGPAPRPRRSAEEVRQALGVRPGQPLVVTVARLHPQKDLPTLLAAAAELRRRVPDVVVVVVGEGPLEGALRTRAAAHGLDATVRFVGPSSNAADELAAADVVALSSRWEGSPLVVAEALALGRPVVATAVGAVPEAVTDGVSGRLVPPGDPDALADALAAVLADPAGAATMARAGQAVAAARLAPEPLLDAVAQLYDAVVGGS